MSRILIIDDDQALARSLEIHLSTQGHAVRRAHTLADGWELFRDGSAEIVFLDLKLPDGDSRGVLGRILAARPETIVVMISGHQDMQAVIEAIRKGAFDYIRKPLDLNQIMATLAKAEDRLSPRQETVVPSTLPLDPPMRREIVGRSPAILEILKQIAVLSESRVTVLIQGETGTGKELVARALHDASNPAGPFVAVNCGGIVPTLLESELFGHEKGSFTGAVARKVGKLELAGRGTIFFDEIGDLPLDLQAKLLRALQEQEFERVGGTGVIPLEARVIAATHRDLESMTREGTFRQDLFYRIAVARLMVPALSDRKEDIPLLAEFLLRRLSRQLEKPPTQMTPAAMQLLQECIWTGNVRELENVLTRTAALNRGEIIRPEDIRFDSRRPVAEAAPSTREVVPLRLMEAQYIAEVLQRLDWNITHTAKALEISPTTLRKKIADYHLERSADSLPSGE